VLAHRVVLSFHKGRVDASAGRRPFPIRLQRFRRAKNHFRGDFHDPTLAPMLHHLSVQQVRRGHPPGLGLRASLTLALGLHPLTKEWLPDIAAADR